MTVSAVKAEGNEPDATISEIDGVKHIEFAIPGGGGFGKDGATFIPNVAPVPEGHELSWTNDQELPNPEPFIIADGKDGNPGVYQGPEEPTDPEVKVWIDTDGTEDPVKIPVATSNMFGGVKANLAVPEDTQDVHITPEGFLKTKDPLPPSTSADNGKVVSVNPEGKYGLANPDHSLGITNAKAGSFVSISEVDEYLSPTKWNTISGEQGDLIGFGSSGTPAKLVPHLATLCDEGNVLGKNDNPNKTYIPIGSQPKNRRISYGDATVLLFPTGQTAENPILNGYIADKPLKLVNFDGSSFKCPPNYMGWFFFNSPDKLIPMGIQENNSLGIPAAQVGQIAKIKAVGTDGKPTEWEGVDLPSGGGERWEYINSMDMTSASNTYVFSEDEKGQPFSLTKAKLICTAEWDGNGKGFSIVKGNDGSSIWTQFDDVWGKDPFSILIERAGPYFVRQKIPYGNYPTLNIKESPENVTLAEIEYHNNGTATTTGKIVLMGVRA